MLVDGELLQDPGAAGGGAGDSGLLAGGWFFFFMNSVFLLAFLLSVEGLGFFLAGGLLKLGDSTFSSPLVSREKVKEVPVWVREKVKALPWLTSAWQRSRHLVAMAGSPSLTASISVLLLC